MSCPKSWLAGFLAWLGVNQILRRTQKIRSNSLEGLLAIGGATLLWVFVALTMAVWNRLKGRSNGS